MKNALTGMSWTRRCVALALGLAGVAGALAQGAPVSLQGEGPYYRLTLPIAAYSHAPSPDLSALRVRNARGHAVPYAWLRYNTVPPRVVSHKVPIFELPVGSDGATGEALAALSVRPDGSLAFATRPARSRPRHAHWILDLSQIEGSLLQAQFDIGPDVEGVFAFTLEGSDDLRQWDRLGGEEQLLRLVRGGQTLERLKLDLGGTKVRFLRLRWSDPQQGVDIRSVVVTSAQNIEAATPQAWSPPLQAERCEASFCDYLLPKAFSLEALRIRLAEPNTLAPLRVLSVPDGQRAPPQHVSRNPLHALRQTRRPPADPDLPLEVPLAESVVYRLSQPGGGEARSPALEIDGTVVARLRLRTRGSMAMLGSVPPEIEVATTPRTLIFLAQGQGPFSLDWAPPGRATDGAALDLASLMPGRDPGKPLSTGEAHVVLREAVVAAPASRAEAAASKPEAQGGRKFWLWGALVAALALLGAMAWSLLRRASNGGAKR